MIRYGINTDSLAMAGLVDEYPIDKINLDGDRDQNVSSIEDTNTHVIEKDSQEHNHTENTTTTTTTTTTTRQARQSEIKMNDFDGCEPVVIPSPLVLDKDDTIISRRRLQASSSGSPLISPDVAVERVLSDGRYI